MKIAHSKQGKEGEWMRWLDEDFFTVVDGAFRGMS